MKHNIDKITIEELRDYLRTLPAKYLREIIIEEQSKKQLLTKKDAKSIDNTKSK